jgi:outer membrane lipoprotein LolB
VHRSTRCLLLLGWASAGLLGGCALRQPEVAPGVDWAQRSERLLALDSWQARGRIAVKAEKGGGQGDLVWEQHGAQARIHMAGPFGAGAYEIRWDERSLTVSSRNGEFSRGYTGPDAAEQFLAEQLGWSFPAASTRYWLLALADPASPAQSTFAADGRLAALDQNGWAVTYDRYTEQSGLPMPAKITLENSRARVRLVIDRWTL